MAKPRKPNPGLTNRDLGVLLTSLGFQSSSSTSEFHRIWQHPEAGTLIILPANKDDTRPLEASLDSLRTHLYYNGHMETSEFDEFVKTGKLTVS